MSGQAVAAPIDPLAEFKRKQAEYNTRRLEERNSKREEPTTDYVVPRRPDGSIDWDAHWANYDPDEAAQRQQEAWEAHQRERIADLQRMHAEMADLHRLASWDPTTPAIRRATTSSPRVHRVTRSTRTTTARRTTAHASSARSSDADDGGGEPPGDPAPLGAEGRPPGGVSDDPGPWLTSIEAQLLYREMAQQARRRSRRLREMREQEGWA